MGVFVQNVVKRFGATTAVDGVSFEVPDGKLLSILGPSGSGKTTLLRCIAGVETPESGVIRIGSKTAFDSAAGVDLPPEERGVGMVFQSGALWPHMTVQKNISYPLDIRGEAGRDAMVAEVLSLLKMERLAGRYPSEISGGEQQRVAIARAIVYRPSLVLLDEPFSSLDVLLREALRDDLRQLQIKLGTTMVYVTHDRVDAMSLGDMMILMSEGRVAAIGDPTSLLRSPPNSYAARFLGGMLVVEGDSSPAGEGALAVATELGTFSVPSSRTGGRVKLCVPPGACELPGGEGGPTITGTVAGVVKYPSGYNGVRVSTAAGIIEVHSSIHDLRPGDQVRLTIDPRKCLVLDA